MTVQKSMCNKITKTCKNLLIFYICRFSFDKYSVVFGGLGFFFLWSIFENIGVTESSEELHFDFHIGHIDLKGARNCPYFFRFKIWNILNHASFIRC